MLHNIPLFVAYLNSIKLKMRLISNLSHKLVYYMYLNGTKFR